MIYVLYDILTHVAIAALLPYFMLKMFTARKYREGISERFGFIDSEKTKALGGKKTVWVHAVSVGETKAVAPLLKLLKERNPALKIAFSTVTKTGQKVASEDLRGLIDTLIYFPLDLSWAVRRVIRRLNPVAFVVAEKEVWPNLYHTLSRNSVPIIVVNGTISERSHKRFLKLGFFFRDIFGSVDYFCARTADDLKRAIDAGVSKERAAVMGNLKFDLKPPKLDPQRMDSIRALICPSRVIVAGSTHQGEEEIVLDAFKRLRPRHPDLKLVIAPRHPERFNDVEGLIRKTGLSYARRTKGGGGEVLMLDTVGELMAVYSFSTISIVGGSLVGGIGGHNLLEPAYFGKPVLYGSHLTTYLNMAEMLEAGGGGVRVPEGGLYDALSRLLEDDVLRTLIGESAKKVVEANTGATARCAQIIERSIR